MSPAQILGILWKRSWMIALAFISTLVGAAGIMLLVPPRYDAIATASVDPGQLDPVTQQSTGASTMLRILQGNLIALAQSSRVATDVVKRLNLARDPRMAAAYASSTSRDRMSIEEWIASEYLLKNLDAKFTEGSNILTIKYKTNSPTQAALIANTFLSVFIDAAVELKTSSAQQTARWFEPQMEKMQAELKIASEKLAQYQRETNLIAIAGGVDTESNQLVSITNELSTAKSQLLLLQSQTSPTNQNTKDQKGKDQSANAQRNLALLPDSSTLVSIKQNLATLIAEIGKLQAEVGEANPKLANLRATRRSLEDQIRLEVSLRDKALREQIQFLEKARAEQLQKMISAQSQRDQLNTLQRDVQSRQEQIDTAAKTAGTARLQSRLSFLNISTLDNATPPGSPAFPKLFVVMALGVGAGLALGVIFALLAEALDRRIRVIADLEFAASAPVLGTLLNLSPTRRLLSGFRRASISQDIRGIIGPSRRSGGRTHALSDLRSRDRTGSRRS